MKRKFWLLNSLTFLETGYSDHSLKEITDLSQQITNVKTAIQAVFIGNNQRKKSLLSICNKNCQCRNLLHLLCTLTIHNFCLSTSRIFWRKSLDILRSKRSGIKVPYIMVIITGINYVHFSAANFRNIVIK